MKALDALNIINDITSHQWGMLTSAQAAHQGISRMNLSRLVANGHLERMLHGVYRNLGAPASRLDAIYAAWLSLSPTELSYQRPKRAASDLIVSGVTAAYIHEAGELNPEPLTFSSRHRRQPRNATIKVVVRMVDEADVSIIHGLPVTKIERTIADLVTDGTDLSLVGNVLRDAEKNNLSINHTRLITLLDQISKVSNPKINGETLYRQLKGI
jgi:predicted transcriptional regulator of viral defense system